jgi:hypothetical protein
MSSLSGSGSTNPVATMIQRQLEATRIAEDEVLDGIQGAVDRWCERRHRTVRAFADFGREMLEARTPQDVMAAWVQLSKGAMERITEDARDQIEVGTRVMRCVAGGPMGAMWEATQEAGGGTAKIARGYASPMTGEEARH